MNRKLKRRRNFKKPGRSSHAPQDGPSAVESLSSLKETASHIWELRLYVAGQSPKSLAAFANLKRICEEHLQGRYKIEVVDLLKSPQLAATDQIVALPALVRKLPQPIRKIVGDLSNTERTLIGLHLRSCSESPAGGLSSFTSQATP